VALLGSSITVFIGITVVLTGYAAFRTGQAFADTWRPYWPVPVCCVVLTLVTRFLIWGLFRGDPWAPGGLVLGAGVLILFGTFAYMTTRARKMVYQYPWLYRRAGLFSWQPLQPDTAGRQSA